MSVKKLLVDGSPVSTDWLMTAEDEDLRALVEGDAMNICLDYLHWHRALLQRVEKVRCETPECEVLGDCQGHTETSG